MKRFLALILMLSLLCCGTIAFAAETETETATPRASDYFASYGMAVTAIGSGKLQLEFSCTGIGICDQLGVATYTVQRKNDSGNWEDVTGLLNGSTRTDVVSHTFCKIFYGVKGDTYRVKTTFVCVKDSSVEHKSYTSGSRKAT